MAEKNTAKTEPGEVDLSKIPTPGASRLAAMDGISNHRVQQLAEDNELDVDEIRGKSEPAPAPAEEEVVIKAEEDEVIKGEEEEEELADQIAMAMLDDEQLSQTMVKIKVNGEEQQVSVADLIVDAQKVKAATKKFEEASRLRKEADEILAKAKESKPVKTGEGNDLETTDTDTDQLPGQDVVKQAVEALYSGDEETAVAAFLELLKQNGRGNTTQADEQQPLDVDDITAQVAERISQKGALDKFRAEYSDVWKNPTFAQRADEILATKLDEGMDFSKALTAAGEGVREEIAEAAKAMGFTKREEPHKDKETTDKKARKETIDNVKGSGDTASTTVAEEKPQSVSDVIKEMGQQRGVNRHF